MEHLKNFEKFDNSLNEGVKTEMAKILVKNILLLPLNILAFGIIQFLPPNIMLEQIQNNLNVYYNIDKILEILKLALNDEDITDSQKSKVKYNIYNLEKVKRKYPTLEDYKKLAKKRSYIVNIRNIEYLKNQIDKYQPHDMSLFELIKIIKKISKIGSEYTGEYYRKIKGENPFEYDPTQRRFEED